MVQLDILIEDTRWSQADLSALSERACDAVFAALGVPPTFEVSILGCDDTRIIELNGSFLEPDPSVPELGDIAISYDTCALEAQTQGKSFEHHVTHLISGDTDTCKAEHSRPILVYHWPVSAPATLFGKGPMSQDTDASSSAAPSAQDDKSDAATRRPGLFQRLTGALASSKPLANDDVAVPRADMVAVPVDMALDELIKVFRDSGLTRLPVYKETLDTPIGLIHLKDLALKHGFNGKGASRAKFSMKRLVREVLFVPPSMPIGVLLQKMQSGRKHMALVIDEYGGVDGLVTIEDLIEQVIGEIEDEHDVEEAATFRLEKPGTYIVQSRASLEEFEKEIGLRLSDEEMDEDIDSLGGLVFVLTGRVPARGEVIEHPSGAEFEILDADPRRIKRIRVRLPGVAAE